MTDNNLEYSKAATFPTITPGLEQAKANFHVPLESRVTLPPCISLNNNELNLENLSQQENGTYDIQFDGKVVGKILKRNDQIIVKIISDVELVITGNAAIDKLHVKSKGDVKLDAELKNNSLLMVSSKNLSVSKPIYSARPVELTAVGNTVIDASISCPALIIKSGNECINNQKIEAKKIKINAKSVSQNGICKSDEKLKVQCQTFHSSASSVTQSENKFVFLGDQVDSHGCFNAKGLAFFSAGNINIHHQFNLPAHTHLHATSLKISDTASFNLDGLESNAAVEIDKELVVDAKAHMRTAHASLSASSIKNAGTLSAQHGPVRANQLINQGTVNFAEADVQVKYKVVGENGSTYHLESSELKTQTLETKGTGKFNAKKVVVDASNSCLNGDTTLVGTTWNATSFQQGGASSYQACAITYKNSFKVLPGANLTGHTATFQGQQLICNGNFSLEQSSSVKSKQVKIDSGLDLDNSSIEAETVDAGSKSRMTAKSNSPISAEKKLTLNGKNIIDHSSIQSKEIMMEGVATLTHAKVNASELIRLGDVKGGHVEMAAPVINYLKEHHFEDSKIISTLDTQKGIGTFKNSDIQSQFDSIDENARIALQGSAYKSRLISSSGGLSLDNTHAETNCIHLEKGKLSATQSNVIANKSILTKAQSATELTQSKLTTDAGSFHGSVKATKSDMTANTLLMSNENTFDQSKVTAKEALMLQGKQTAHATMFAGKGITISGDMSLQTQSIVQADEDLVLGAEAKVIVTNSVLKAQNAIKNFGEITAEKSAILAKDIASYHKLKATQSKVAAEKTISLEITSDTELESSELDAHSIDAQAKLKAKQTKMTAKQEINFHSASKTIADNLVLKSDEAIHFQRQSEVTGDSLSAKAGIIHNQGTVNTASRLGLDADYIINEFGQLGSNGDTQLTAARLFSNMGGRVTGKQTKISALASVNMMGDVCGKESLAVNSLLNINAGLYRSYSANINSLIDINAGLVLPTLPSSLNAAFKPQHLITASRILLTNFIPGKAKLIDFAFRAVPLAYSGVKMGASFCRDAYGIAASTDRHWNELLPTVPSFAEFSQTIREKRVVDYMQPFLTAKNMVVSTSGLYRSVNQLSFDDVSMSGVASAFTMPTWKNLASVPMTVLGPTFSSNSVASLNLGVVASQNSIHSSVFSMNNGVDVALQSNTTNTMYMSNNGVIAANQVTLTGTELNNRGYIGDREKMNINFNTIDNQGHGVIDANYGVIVADALNNNAKLNLTTGQLAVKDHLTVGESGVTTISHGQVTAGNLTNSGNYTATQSSLSTEHLLNNGVVDVDNSTITAVELNNNAKLTLETVKLDVKDNLTMGVGGVATIAQSLVTAGNLSNSGSLTATQSALNTEHLLNNGIVAANNSIITAVELDNNAKLDLETVKLDVKDNLTMGVGGVATIAQSLVTAGNLSNSGSLTATQSALNTEHLLNNGIVAADNSIITAVELDNNAKLSLEAVKLDVKDNLTVGVDGVTTMTQSLVTADNVSNLGNLTTTQTTLDVKEEIVNHENAQLNLTETSVQAGRFVNAGVEHLSTVFIKSDQEYIQTATGSCTTDTVSIQSKTQSLDGHYHTANTEFSAENDMDVKKTAVMEIEKNTRISGENISFSATVANQDTLELIAKEQLNTTVDAHVTGNDGSVYMSGKTGSVNGSMSQKNIAVEIDHLKNAEDFVTGTGSGKDIKASSQFYCKIEDSLVLSKGNQREGSVAIVAADITVNADQQVNGNYYLEASKGNINANANVHAAQDLALKSKEDITNNRRSLTAGQDASLDAGHSVHNIKGSIVANRNASIVAESGEARNTAGMLQGKNHIEVIAKEGITNEAMEYNVRGKHDTVKRYETASILGGKGDGFDGNGVVLVTDGKLINDASNIAAIGNVGISAKEGVQFKARTHTYLADEYTKRSGCLHHHKTHVRVYDTQVQKSTVGSTEGKVTIISEDGGVKSVATDIYAAQGIAIVADKKVELYDLVAQRRVIKNQSSLWGATHNNERSLDEFSVPTTLSSRRDILLYSSHDDINLRGTVVSATGKFTAVGDNVTMSVSKLRHEYTRETTGFNVSMFGQTLFGSNAPQENAPLPFTSPETTYDHINTLLHSNGVVETALNTMNTATTVANTANSVVQGVRNNDLLKEGLNHFGAGNIEPSVKVTYTKETEKRTSESLGEGSVTAGSIELTARKGNVTLEGLPVVAAGGMKVTADAFIQKGMDLESHHSTSSTSVGVGMSCKTGAPTDVSVNESKSSETRHDFVNQQLQVGGKLEINVNTWQQDGANADVGSLSGHADVHEIITHTSELQAKSSSVGVSSGGDFNVAENKTNATVISQTSGVHIRGDGTNEQNTFDVGVLHSKGGVIEGGGNTNYHAGKIIAEDVHESIKSSGFSISGNVNDMMSANPPTNQINANADEGQQIKTVGINLSNSDYKATQHATVALGDGSHFSKDEVTGSLVTDMSKSKEVTRDESHQYTAEVPIIDDKTLIQMRDNAAWVESKVTGGEYQPQVSFNDAILAHEKFKSPEEVEAYVEKIKHMEEISGAVYGSDGAPEGYHEVDAGFVNPDTEGKVVAYVNDSTGELVFSFRGTANATNLIKDDKDIVLGDAPSSFDAATRQYIDDTMRQYPDYQVAFTGHSMGAAEAAVASSYYGCPAYVFDNPGISNSNSQYDFSNVTSFQSAGNVVNQAGPLTGRDFDKGNVVQLSATDAQRLLAAGAQQLGIAGSALVTATNNHRLSQLNQELDDYLNKQVSKAQPYRGPTSSTFFKPAANSAEHRTPAQQSTTGYVY